MYHWRTFKLVFEVCVVVGPMCIFILSNVVWFLVTFNLYTLYVSYMTSTSTAYYYLSISSKKRSHVLCHLIKPFTDKFLFARFARRVHFHACASIIKEGLTIRLNQWVSKDMKVLAYLGLIIDCFLCIKFAACGREDEDRIVLRSICNFIVRMLCVNEDASSSKGELMWRNKRFKNFATAGRAHSGHIFLF